MRHEFLAGPALSYDRMVGVRLRSWFTNQPINSAPDGDAPQNELRSFLRFLVLRGELARDLSGAVARVRTYQQSGVSVVLSPEEVERVLATADRSTPRGRRDYAVLLLLARLGLRANEIVTLELGDVRWRVGEIVVRGKGPRRDHVPLLADVGNALTRYVHEDRGTTNSRCVFLRLIPPRGGVTRPCR